jgi:hypothetical protein
MADAPAEVGVPNSSSSNSTGLTNTIRLTDSFAVPQLHESEVYFLVLKWLLNGPCSNAAQALLQDVHQHALLPQRYTVKGEQNIHSCCVTYTHMHMPLQAS